MKSEVIGFQESGERIRFETGKIVQNWARTFECTPERYYTPCSENEVIQVLF
jgi:hypothetical protein